MYIDCFWVSGAFKGHGYANDLLEECIKDAKQKGKIGLCVLSSNKKKPFLSDPKFLKYKGFQIADESTAGINLMYLPFDKTVQAPSFKTIAKDPTIEDHGFVLYYTNQCPFNAKYVPILAKVAQEHQIPFTINHITSKEEAQNVPSPCTTYAFFYDGKFITNEQMNDQKFLKIVEQLL